MLFLVANLFLFYLLTVIRASDYDIELLSDNCDCRDWYGACRQRGTTWTDDETWKYECQESEGHDAQFVGCTNGHDTIKVGTNTTIDGLWNSCEQSGNVKLVYAIEPHCRSKTQSNELIKVGQEYRDGTFQWLCLGTGQWVTGCFYNNETHNDLLLPVDQIAYNGLIEHHCSKLQEYPAVVQYFTRVSTEVPVKHPSNKGVNKNFPEPVQKLLPDAVKNQRWLHSHTSIFVHNDKPFTRIRYLAGSRKPI